MVFVLAAAVVLISGLVWWRRSGRRGGARRTAELLYAGLIDITPEVIIAVDDAQRVIAFNHSAEEVFGYRAAEVLGAPLDRLLPERVAELHRRHIREFAAAPKSGRRMNERGPITGRRKDGTEFPAEASITKQIIDGRMTFTVVLRDVTERMRMERKLLDSERRFREFAENIQEVFWMGNPDQSRIVYVSPAYATIWGGDERPLYTTPGAWLEAIHPDDRERVRASIAKNQPSGRYDEEYRIIRPDGGVRWIRDRAFPVRDESGRRSRVVGIAEDVTERRTMEEAIHRAAFYDTVTALPNRNLLYSRLNAVIEESRRTGKVLALLLMDLDHFREINDTLGHRRGDLLLQQLGERLRQSIFDRDFVARLGGDEFAVLLKDLSSREDIRAVIGKITQALEPFFTIEEVPIAVETSIGVSLYPEHGVDADTLIQRADIALYTAKKSGSGHALYSQELDPYSPQRLALMGELRDAIEQQQLVLHYQPVIDLTTRAVFGVEALVRWQHPKRGMIPPDQFISLAEQTGLIHPLTRWVLETAMRQCVKWQQAGLDLTMSVNLSARNLVDQKLPKTVAALLRASGVAPHRIRVEITESAIMTDPAGAEEVLAKLDGVGLRLSIDDFGTGYSSLSHLRKMPVDEIKVDRSFVSGMTRSEDDAAIVRSTIDLAHHLDLRVVAEGVETEAELRRLIEMGCDAAQGYHFSRPLPPDTLDEWLRHSSWASART